VLSKEVNAEPVKTEVESGDAGKSLEERLFSFLGLESDDGNLSEALKWSFLIFILAFLGGVLDSMTPCVYPIIPVVISYMGAKSGSKKRAGFVLSLFFVLGLSITYSIVGLLASFLGDKFGVGSFVGNPWVMVSIATIFFVLSLSMFGFYDINLMSSSSKTKMMQKNYGGPLGAVFLGAVSGIIAAPCVGPVLAALLLHVTLVGDILYGWLLLMTFAFGLGLLFIVIGTFSGALNSLPKAGAWMVNIKKFFGVLMIGAALYFVKNVFDADIHSVIVGLTIIFFSFFLVAGDNAGDGYKNFIKTLNLFLKTIALVLIISAFLSILNIALPGVSGGVINRVEKVEFFKEGNNINILDDFAQKSKTTGKLIIVDLWADWCPNCIILDKTIWKDKEVVEVIKKNYLPVKLDFSDSGSEFHKYFLKKYQKIGANNPPVIMILDENLNQVVKPFIGITSKEKILPILHRLSK